MFGLNMTLEMPPAGLVTPMMWSALFRVTFLRDICTNWAVALLFLTRFATISAFTASRNMSTSSSR
ncbi:MAG: hypothetical protein A4E30_00177 [Methanomassiliicoccales archaeon PtaB.Bin215]|nr:MAG: hypothetical protein A4E30_00177 [Methanomassiliicoccales archaeon PtaB.Bin215]